MTREQPSEDSNRTVAEVLRANGHSELNPTQSLALRAGLLAPSSFVVASPTASGKTLIGEVAVIDAVRRGKKGIYLVPLRSLGNEKFEDFTRYKGIKVVLKTGDYDTKEEGLKDYQIIVATYEKWDSILRHRPNWLEQVGCVVADEGHMMTDGSRGSTRSLEPLSYLVGNLRIWLDEREDRNTMIRERR